VFRYGFTRNPWDRVVSLYELLHPATDPKRQAFKDWVLEGMRGPGYDGVPIVAPTLRWLRGCQFIGRFEHRERDLTLLAQMLGRAVPTKHVGATDRRPYPEYYDEETREIVGVLYKEDIDHFGYTYD